MSNLPEDRKRGGGSAAASLFSFCTLPAKVQFVRIDIMYVFTLAFTRVRALVRAKSTFKNILLNSFISKLAYVNVTKEFSALHQLIIINKFVEQMLKSRIAQRSARASCANHQQKLHLSDSQHQAPVRVSLRLE